MNKFNKSLNEKNKYIWQASLVFISALIFYCYEFYLRLLTGAYETNIVQHLHISSHLGFSFLISSYNWTYLLMQIPTGILLDKYGSRKIIILAVIACGAGNIIFLSTNYEVALIGRLLVGFGSSFAFVGVLKIAREYFPAHYFSFFASVVISIGTLAAAFSEQLSVWVSSFGIQWISIFYYSGCAAIPIAFFVYISIPKNLDRSHTKIMPDWSMALKQAYSLIKSKKIWLIALWGGLLYIPTVILTAQYGVLYFKSIYQVDRLVATEYITYLLMGWVIFSPLISYLTVKFKGSLFFIYSLIFISALILIALTYFSGTIQEHLVLIVFLFGCFSAVQVLTWHAFNKSCPLEYTAIGVAVINMIITLVTEIGQLASGSMLDWKSGIHFFASNIGFSIPMQFNVVLFLVAIFLALIITPKVFKN
jgi:MFS family permease